MSYSRKSNVNFQDLVDKIRETAHPTQLVHMNPVANRFERIERVEPELSMRLEDSWKMLPKPGVIYEIGLDARLPVSFALMEDFLILLQNERNAEGRADSEEDFVERGAMGFESYFFNMRQGEAREKLYQEVKAKRDMKTEGREEHEVDDENLDKAWKLLDEYNPNGDFLADLFEGINFLFGNDGQPPPPESIFHNKNSNDFSLLLKEEMIDDCDEEMEEEEMICQEFHTPGKSLTLPEGLRLFDYADYLKSYEKSGRMPQGEFLFEWMMEFWLYLWNKDFEKKKPLEKRMASTNHCRMVAVNDAKGKEWSRIVDVVMKVPVNFFDFRSYVGFMNGLDEPMKEQAFRMFNDNFLIPFEPIF